MALPLAALLTGGALWAGYQLGIEAGAPDSNGQMAAFGLQQEPAGSTENWNKLVNRLAIWMRWHCGWGYAGEALRMEALGEELVKIGELIQ